MTTLAGIAPTSGPARRKAWRLSIGAMMVLVVAIGCALGWIAHRARLQRAAITAIQKARGAAFYRGEDARNVGSKSRAPKWLQKWIGRDVFDSITFATLTPGAQLDDRLMTHLGALDRLEELSLGTSARPERLTAVGMSQFGKLKYLKTLHISGLANLADFAPALGELKNLRSLRMQISYATDDDMTQIGRLTAIEELDISTLNVTDSGFARLAKLTKMQSLALRGCVVTDLSPLAGMPNLKFVMLGNQSPTATNKGLRSVSLAPLLDKRKLISIQLSNIPTDDSNLKRIASLPSLGMIGVSGARITEEGLAELSKATGLGSLTLHETAIHDLHPLGALSTTLGAIDVEGSPITDEGLSPFAGASRLRMLNLSQTKVTDAGLAHLSMSSGLSSLYLNGTSITDAGLARLSGMTALRNLELAGTNVSGEGFSNLSGAKQLLFLNLQNSRVTDEGLAFVAKLRGLRQLNLNGTRVSDAGLPHLKAATSLEGLQLCGTRVTDDGLAHLAHMPRLRDLWLEETNITDAGLVHIARLRSMRQLLTHGTRITDGGLARLKAQSPAIRVLTAPLAKSR
jgi:internalin A